MRYLVILLVGFLLLAVLGCDETATTTSTIPPTTTSTALTTTGRQAYKEAYNILGLTVRLQELLAIADSIDTFGYPDVDALRASIATEEQALRTLLPAEPSPEYVTVNDAMMAALRDLSTACTYKERFDADRGDVESFMKLKQLANGALTRVFATERAFNILLTGIGHSLVHFPA